MSTSSTPAAADAALERLRYPTGRFDPHQRVGHEQRGELIDRIARAPAELRRAVAGLSEQQLAERYREGGWTLRQVVHHVADSHINAWVRFKLALTEDVPRIKTYDEARWAELPDTAATPIDVSLTLLDALHARWVALLRSMTDEDFARTIEHAEWGRPDLSTMLCLYAWHGAHHTAHITSLRERRGW
jgi:uncharacterized damage-inducible protein DinB